MSMLLLLVVTLAPAILPTAMLLPPVVLKLSAPEPIAVFSLPGC